MTKPRFVMSTILVTIWMATPQVAVSVASANDDRGSSVPLRHLEGPAGGSAPSPDTDVVLNGDVTALALSGDVLYVGGSFTDAAGIPEADRIARWDGSSWSALGSGPSRTPVATPAPMCCSPAASSSTPDADVYRDGALEWTVSDLAVVDDDLFVAGGFTDAAGIPEADYLAKWDGTEWSALGSNGEDDGALDSTVSALAVSGSDLYVGGTFTVAGVPGADQVARWDGNRWSALARNGSGDRTFGGFVFALAAAGSDVYVGGIVHFLDASGAPRSDRVVRWDGAGWSAMGARSSGAGALDNLIPATTEDEENFVFALAARDSDLFVGGRFTDAADIPEADQIARWDGRAWAALGSDGAGDGALDGTVNAIVVSGTDLYVGGEFTDAAGIPEADYLAKWDGNEWSAVGSNGAGDGAFGAPVHALVVSGTDLYVGGEFTNVAGVTGTDHIARWDGTNWSRLAPDSADDGEAAGPLPALTGDVDTFVEGTCAAVDELFLAVGNPDSGVGSKLSEALEAAIGRGNAAAVESTAAAMLEHLQSARTATARAGSFVPAAEGMSEFDAVLAIIIDAVEAERDAAPNGLEAAQAAAQQEWDRAWDPWGAWITEIGPLWSEVADGLPIPCPSPRG